MRMALLETGKYCFVVTGWKNQGNTNKITFYVIDRFSINHLDYCNGFHGASLSWFYDSRLLDCRRHNRGKLFKNIALHEVAHSIVALKYELKIRQIVLFIFGGVSDISDEPKDYRKEAKMALVGPATSFMLAGIFTLFWWLVSYSSAMGFSIYTLKQVTLDILYYAALINAILGGFNLIPAFPSDGGRILRAALVRLRKDYDKGTKRCCKCRTQIKRSIASRNASTSLRMTEEGDPHGGETVWAREPALSAPKLLTGAPRRIRFFSPPEEARNPLWVSHVRVPHLFS